MDHGDSARVLNAPESRIGRFATGSLVVLIGAMIVLGGAGVVFALFARVEAASPTGDLPPPDPARARPATLESAWPMVEARARAWDPDAQLFSAASQYDWPREQTAEQRSPAGGWLIYVFVSGEHAETESLAIMVERNRAEITREKTRVLGTDAVALDPADVMEATIPSQLALDIALAAAGAAFRAECPSARFVTRQTFRPASGGAAPAWIVSFGDSRVRNGPPLTVQVVAATGDAIVRPFEGSDPPLSDLGECPE